MDNKLRFAPLAARAGLVLALMAVLVAWVGIRPVAAQGGTTYTVRAGDSLTAIAARHGVTASQLAAANGIRWDSWVYTGQRLTIPGASAAPAPAAAAAAAGGTYTVRPGDTLVGIAARHGVTAAQLASVNGISQGAWVYVGQKLRISGGSAPAPSNPPAQAASSSGTYIVRAGDTLISIAIRHGLRVTQLATANGIYTNAWVYTGQRLRIPNASAAPTTPAPPAAGGTYTVRPGDTLIGIALRHGFSVSQLAAINGLFSHSWVYTGQLLQLPGTSSAPAPAPVPTAAPAPAPAPAPPAASGGKWIDVNLTTQTLTAFQGQTAVHTARVSTGTWRTPTVVGTFRIYVKYVSAGMSGPGYNLPNVPYVMYFYRGYGLHGTYWHNNFGTPMSHGCVNLPTPDAQWIFNWAPVGTQVVTHY